MSFSGYKNRCLNGATNNREMLLNKARRDFLKYLKNTPTSDYLQITEIGEPLISDSTRSILTSVVDVANNDKRAFDEKNLYMNYEEDVDVGCYVRYEDSDWLIVFREHDPLKAKKHFIMKKCNNFMTLKYKGIFYKIPILVDNLTMYSDGISDNINVSFPDSKKLIWYSDNEITRCILEGFRILLTHRTAFKVTHINDFEHKGITKSLVVQTAFIDGDDAINRYANNEEFFKINTNIEKEARTNKINGDRNITIGEEKTYSLLNKKNTDYIWNLVDNKGFEIITNDKNTITIKGSNNFRLIGSKTKLQIIDKKDSTIIDEIELVLRR